MSEIFDPTQLRVLLDVIIASILGGMIGFDREKRDKPAGIRTNMIVCGVACLLVSLGYITGTVFGAMETKTTVNPMRIIQTIIIGVSFIGSGTILKLENKEKVKNLSTAATLLYSATVGIAIGIHQYVIAVGVTLFAIITEYGVLQLEKRMKKDGERYDLD
jgi:putative Mg2+ transporter-C (MgtC) family protein